MVSSHASRRVLVALVALTMLMVMAAPASAKPKSTTNDPLITGLVGPLGLAVGQDGTVYVADAFAGTLTSIDKQGNAHVLIDAPGSEIAGVDAKGKGTLVYTQSLFDPEAGPESPALDAVVGRVQPNGSTRTLASTLDYERNNNPDQGNEYGLDPAGAADAEACLENWPIEFLGPPTYSGIVDSHPYAIAIVPGGYVVADAAANALLRVTANGQVSTLAVLPPIPQEITQEVLDTLPPFLDLSDCLGATYLGEPVPTDVEVGPDGYYYVSTLPGGPEAPGAGAVWKVNPRNGNVSLVTAGLTSPVDIAVGADGTIWVAELFAFQISTIQNGVPTPYMFAPLPGAIEVGPDGSVFAVINALPPEDGPPNGQVVRITP